MTTPAGLGVGGIALWKAITESHELDPAQLVQLEEACRAKDRCDVLDSIMAESGIDPKWLAQANATANLMKQLLAAMRLPDVKTGQRPQVRSARGAYAPRTGSSKDRLKAV